MSSYKLPPISEIKFSESIKRKLYYDPRKIVFPNNSSNNNNTNNVRTNSINSSKSKNELFTDHESFESKNANNNNKEDNTEFSDNTENDLDEDEIKEIEDEDEDDEVVDDEDEETDDEFVYLYEENKHTDAYLSDEEDDELSTSNLDYSFRKRHNSPASEIESLKKQLSFLKKENYYMQLAINKLESRLRRNKEINLNELELQKHLASIERFLTYRHRTITTTTTTARTIANQSFYTNHRKVSNKLPELNFSKQLDFARTHTSSRLTLPKLNLERKYLNDNDEDNKIYSLTSRF